MTERDQPVDWPTAARTLLARFGERGLHPVAARRLFGREGAECVLVACSGGADSMFLLCLLWARAEMEGRRLVVAHYNHRWRGEASAGDADFVRDAASALSCPYTTGERPAKEAAFTETTARTLRLEFLRAAAAQQGCGVIALGHQQDDILETQLQRLARGSGTEGLAAPRPVHLFQDGPAHVRPLLHLRAGDIRMGLHAVGIPWRDDATNSDLDIARNGLRHQVIPGMVEALGRDPAVGAARSRALLEEDAVALDALARAGIPEAFGGAESLSRARLKEVPKALARRALLAWLGRQDLFGSTTASGVDQLLDAVRSGRERHRVSFGSRFVLFDRDRIHLQSALPESGPGMGSSLMRVGESLLLPQGGVLESALVELDTARRAAVLGGAVDVAAEAYLSTRAGAVLEVRGWLPGDRFRPLGAPGGKKLKDWFIARRVPVKERKRLPVVLSSSKEIAWVPGFPPADAFKIGAATKLALRLTYQNRNPL